MSSGAEWRVEVAVALRRPPRADAWLYYVLSDEHADAESVAIEWALCRPGVVMVVDSVVTDWPDDRFSPPAA